jgi:hypothetical protein
MTKPYSQGVGRAIAHAGPVALEQAVRRRRQDFATPRDLAKKSS